MLDSTGEQPKMGVTAPSKCVYPGKASPTRPRDKSRLHPTLQRPSPLKRLERFRSRIFLLGAAGEQEENGLGASASGPARTLTQGRFPPDRKSTRLNSSH